MSGMHRTFALVTALTLAAPAAAWACNISTISGTWLVAVEAEWSDDYFDGPPVEIRTTCWFTISRNRRDLGNLGIHCAEPEGLFGSNEPSVRPWHQIERDSTARNETVGTRRFATPNRCQWRIVDRNGADIEYTVNFAPDFNTLQGRGDGYADRNYGSTEPLSVFFTGIRQ